MERQFVRPYEEITIANEHMARKDERSGCMNIIRPVGLDAQRKPGKLLIEAENALGFHPFRGENKATKKR
jgi:hypothetical protein